MKDIKTFIIGFLTCACLFLIMGQTKDKDYMKDLLGEDYIEQMRSAAMQMQEVMPPPIGRYQAISGNKYEHLYLLDTETGAVYTQIENPDKNTYKKRLADVWKRAPYVNAFSKP